jgi:hypothetical protein
MLPPPEKEKKMSYFAVSITPEKSKVPPGVHILPQRVGDAQKERCLIRLGEAWTDGYLDLAEYEARLVAATAALTQPELDVLTSDLPEQPEIIEHPGETMIAARDMTQGLFLGAVLGSLAFTVNTIAAMTAAWHGAGLTFIRSGQAAGMAVMLFCVYAIIGNRMVKP